MDGRFALPPRAAKSRLMAVAEHRSAARLTEAQKGVLYLVVAHVIWGGMAYYIKLLDHVSPGEIAVHRGLWSLPIAAAVLLVIGGRDELLPALRSRRTVLTLFVCSAIIVFNWGFYVWAIQAGRTAEAALGYYVNPLMNVVVGFLFLGERFNRAQAVALGFVVLAVVLQTFAVGAFPWLGLSLAATFCLYGYLRKKVTVEAVPGFFIEVLLLAPFAIAYLLWLMSSGDAAFLDTPLESVMLVGLGVFTASTLMLFAVAVRRIRYSTVGLLQYISPSLVFLTAVFLFHEPMNPMRWTSFVLIWIGLAIFSWAALTEERARKALERSTSAAESA